MIVGKANYKGGVFMTKKEKVSLNVQDNDLNNIETIKDTVKRLHKKNKDDVPKYLDNIKKEKNIEEKEVAFDNEFLKYML